MEDMEFTMDSGMSGMPPRSEPFWSPQRSPARAPRSSPLTIDTGASPTPWALRTPTRASRERLEGTPMSAMSCESPFGAFAGSLSPLMNLQSPPCFAAYEDPFFKSPSAQNGAQPFGFSTGITPRRGSGGTGNMVAQRLDFGGTMDPAMAAMLPPTPQRQNMQPMEDTAPVVHSPPHAGDFSRMGEFDFGVVPPHPPQAATPQPNDQSGTRTRSAFSTPGVTYPGAEDSNISPVVHAQANQQRKPCHCRKSRCLKLYCECFAAGLYCDGCGCSCCHNTEEHEETRQKAMAMASRRNPNAFKRKIVSRQLDTGDSTAVHTSGCNCKKSLCRKNYCECHQAGIFCGPHCKCVNCQNYEGSEAMVEQQQQRMQQQQQEQQQQQQQAEATPQFSFGIARVH